MRIEEKARLSRGHLTDSAPTKALHSRDFQQPADWSGGALNSRTAGHPGTSLYALLSDRPSSRKPLDFRLRGNNGEGRAGYTSESNATEHGFGHALNRDARITRAYARAEALKHHSGFPGIGAPHA
ncbi:hypothetical protein LUTEI9C_130002 [Luteimonas sp. 9C]|nr:hypothetical protein LUTEI9C_130002 [Luteimonas sp. 9C]